MSILCLSLANVLAICTWIKWLKLFMFESQGVHRAEDGYVLDMQCALVGFARYVVSHIKVLIRAFMRHLF
jgi:hypothetical protein